MVDLMRDKKIVREPITGRRMEGLKVSMMTRADYEAFVGQNISFRCYPDPDHLRSPGKRR